MSTTSDKIRAHFRRFPDADVKKAAAKFNTAVPRVYKLRKEVRETDTLNEGLAEQEWKPKREKVTLTLAQMEIAGRLGIDPYEYGKRLQEYEKAAENAAEAASVLGTEWTAEQTEGGDIVATLTERGKRYGKFTGHARVTQELKRVLWNALADKPELADDQKEALDMICHKLGRIVNGDPNYADSWVDIAGYAKLVSDRLEGVER